MYLDISRFPDNIYMKYTHNYVNILYAVTKHYTPGHAEE